MRPEVLFPLFADIQKLKGVGPRLRAGFERIAGTRVVDLLWHLPVALIDRRYRPEVAELKDGSLATLTVTVGAHRPAPRRGAPYRVECHDASGSLTLVFFNAREDYLRRMLPEGENRLVSGPIDFYAGAPQMTHPHYMLAPEEAESLPLVEPVYPLTGGVSNKVLSKAVSQAVATAPKLAEWIDTSFKSQEDWPDWQEAVLAVHGPMAEADLAPTDPARRRLAYDELLANQLTLTLVRNQARRRKGRSLKGTGALRSKLVASLPYELTGSQQLALADIDGDMAGDDAMLRLIQGDVGSGKTIVAFLAMVTAIEAGTQAVLLAPTEILARQHYAGLKEFADALDVSLHILTGRTKGKGRDSILNRLATGDVQILVGTHAVFQDGVEYKDLGLVVIDEQHRFGVHQRIAMSAKASTPVDTLVMSATPIPRTLTLTYYGDMDVSRITEKPPGRQPIDTRVLPVDRMGEVVSGLRRAIDDGQRAFWVCPLVEESETLDMAAAEERFRELELVFPGTVGLVHGRMKGADKDAVMSDFAAGRIKLLVATTVIEVGVDIPDATIMIVEQAERFGLAQLHQLRGRVGRGHKKSSCLLLRSSLLSETASARLRIMRETEDGFLIAEEDLKLRGAGEVLGTRQSGLPAFRLADLMDFADLLPVARDDARMILEKDERLSSPRGEACRVLLYLFERDESVKLIRSG